VSRGIAALAIVWLLGAELALAGPEPAAAPLHQDRYEELLESFDALRVASTEPSDAVTLLEAEEIAAIAEELLAEGEREVAVTLLEEALRLLAARTEP
jgi:hypothetical protein